MYGSKGHGMKVHITSLKVGDQFYSAADEIYKIVGFGGIMVDVINMATNEPDYISCNAIVSPAYQSNR